MSAHAQTVPPVVSLPVTGGQRGWPFAASLDDLSAIGYLEEERFVEGSAVAYRPTAPFGPDGHWAAEPAGTAFFRTRILVQRPEDPARFNGTVVVGWNNVTAGYELLAELPSILEEGYAYVCASVQAVGIDGVGSEPHGLRAWDPDRYGSLQHPGDRFSYGIFTACARAVGPERTSGPSDPLGGLQVERVLALGASQSAARLATYVNAIQPLTEAFDGFLILIHFGSGASIDDDQVFDANAPRPAPVFRTRTRIRDDLQARIMVVNSETETLAYYPARQPDSERFCFWEVAGASHVSAPQIVRRAAKCQRDGVPMRQSLHEPSHISYVPAASAALDRLRHWVAGGPPPPSQPPIAVLATDPPTIERDEHGNARGGVRLPWIEVPVAHDTGISPETGLAGLDGLHEPFSTQQLVTLYGDREGYLTRFEAAARAAVAAGVLRPTEAEVLVEEARSNPIL